MVDASPIRAQYLEGSGALRVGYSGARSETKVELEKMLHFPLGLSGSQIQEEEQLVLAVFRNLSQISNKSFTVESNFKVFLDQQFSILPDYK